MGKPIERDFTQSKGILKFFPYEGAACIVQQTMVTSADANGKKIAKANWIAERFGLASNREYVLERSYGGLWSVYDFDGHYITECRTDCFDNYRNFK